MAADYQSLLPAVLALALEAGEKINQIYATDFAVENKADQSPLTAADLASHQHIMAGLAALPGWQDIPILSEEAADIAWPVRQQWQRYWLIDPLDGTREFVKRNGEFTVNIALIEAGKPVLGVVVAPVLQRAWFAAQGVGAFRQDAGGLAQALQVQACATPLRVLGSRSHSTPEAESFLARMGEIELLSAGSSIKFCWLAEGLADCYPRIGPTSEWDTAAAQCVLEQAGGEVLTLDGQALRYNSKESLLNPYFIACGQRAPQWTVLLNPPL